MSSCLKNLRGFGCRVAMLASLWLGCAQAQVVDEYKVKAAFLFNFGKFIDWPAEKKSAIESPFRICVLGEDPFRDDLRSSTENRQIKGRSVEVLRIAAAGEASQCQILFISSSERRTLRNILTY